MELAARMSKRSRDRLLYLFASSLAGIVGCHQADVGGIEVKDDPTGIPIDVEEALADLPDVEVLEATADGLAMYLVGDMAKVGGVQTDDAPAASAALMPALPRVLAPFRLAASDLALRKMNVDDGGGRHFRYRQVHDGLEVVGAELVVHVDVKGSVYAVNGNARGDISPSLGAHAISQATAENGIRNDGRWSGLAATVSRLVYLQTLDGRLHKAYETTVEGLRGKNPVRDRVYTDVDDGQIVAVYPQIHFAENRRVYTANNSTSLPGTLRRSEGQAAGNDVDVNAAYDNTGLAYEAYKNFWNRDSYNNAGAELRSSVHYSSNYCNAFWNGTQMVYGDGSASQGCAPLARSTDVTAHELTHAVTENESGLVYSGEPGGMNEAMSDIFGAFVEAWADGGKTGTLAVSNDTWLVGEDIISGGLRKMCDPKADGASADQWTSTVGNLDVHYSSGVPNLMFCLLSRGGTHPRNATAVNVPGIGMAKAIRIMYEAQTNILTSSAKFANVRTAMEQATVNLGYDQATKDAVGCAWAAVKVGTAPATCGGTTPPPPPAGDGVLANNVPQTNQSDATGGQRFWKIDVPAGQTSLTISISGGTGDADMYVSFGTKPTLTSYQCRPYLDGNAETCTFAPPQAGTYWVMLNAYTAYSGLTITGKYAADTGGDPFLTNGVAVTGIAGAASSAGYWRITTPAAKKLTIKISGGTGDVDLYTRFGSRPTTSTYACRPYLTGNTETCTTNSTQAGDYYVMLRGYTAYSGVSLIASY
ncbi:MAG: M4 family metallopeptidase [Deltaproteobacteria bacterium]|nr:M4 family metallopeptidase [Deltaproteobacteria bacterium]